MTHQEKINWMIHWAHKNKVRLELEGECGILRECVGILAGDEHFPDYEWDDDNYNRIDNNGDVWRPEDAYHKHSCVAVLGRGEEAESQLFDWLQWFDKNGFVLEIKPVETKNFFCETEGRLCRPVCARMVRKNEKRL